MTLDVDAARCLHAAIDKTMISGGDEMECAAVEAARERASFHAACGPAWPL